MTIYSPLEQFEIYSIIPITIKNIDISITNSTIYLIIGLLSMIYIFSGTINRMKYVPSTWQTIIEELYNFINDLILQNCGKLGKKYFPFIFTIFIFILICNLLGMLPYSFTVTSHIVITLTLSFSIWLGVTILGIYLHGINFYKLFVPSGAPLAILPMLIILEILSYCMRAISLGVRLFANLMSGHTLLKILTGFTFQLFSIGGLIGLITSFVPLFIVFIIIGLETGIAILQAYVFTVLTIMYLNDAINLH